MAGRLLFSEAEPGFTLPAYERLAPPPPPSLVVARLEAHSGPGDIVADLHGRGGWIARVAIDHQRRGFSLESSPLTRLLAEVVLRPPDLRHLDAAFNGLAASPRGDSSLKLSIGQLFATTCPTCGRSSTIEELTWSSAGEDGPATAARPIRKAYRCTVCRDRQGGGELRTAEPDEGDVRRSRREIGGPAARRRLRERFPIPDGGEDLVKALLGLHTDRQLVGLLAILERIEADLRAAPVESALRLAFLHAVLPASRLGAGPGRIPALRIAGGEVRTAIPDPWRERNPWVAFEEGYRTVRSFVQRLEGGALGPLEARLGADLRALAEGPASAVVRLATPSALTTLTAEAREPLREPGMRAPAAPRIRLVLGQPPTRFSQERLAAAYHATAWTLGREAAALLPLEPLLGSPLRPPWSWQAAMLRRSLEAVAPLMARDGRVVLLLEAGSPEALVAAALGGAGAGYRLVDARLAESDDETGGIVELVPPGGILPPPARNRGNQALEPDPGGRGDPDLVPSPGLFAPPERIDARPFSASEAARSIVETAVTVLKARGEPARYERLLGEILVGLDRTGQLRRLVGVEPPAEPGATPSEHGESSPKEREGTSPAREGTPRVREGRPAERLAARTADAGAIRWAAGRTARAAIGDAALHLDPTADQVERVLALVRTALAGRPPNRVAEIEPGRWWLADRQDLETAEIPLSDRVEWAAYSLLSTAGPIDEAAFFDRIAALFAGHDLPDEALVRACLASYRSPASTPDRLVTGDDLRSRTAQHTELLARLANAGHRLGLSVWLGRREQARRIGDRTLADYLEPRERDPWLPSVAPGPPDDVEAVDCIWYLRGKLAVAFEVEWTAMLGDLLLRRHARMPTDGRLVRILALAPERRELVRHKLEASPVLRAAIESGSWSIVLWPHLDAWLASDPTGLDGLEPYLGLDPPVERRGEQLGLFDRPEALP